MRSQVCQWPSFIFKCIGDENERELWGKHLIEFSYFSMSNENKKSQEKRMGHIRLIEYQSIRIGICRYVKLEHEHRIIEP